MSRSFKLLSLKIKRSSLFENSQQNCRMYCKLNLIRKLTQNVGQLRLQTDGFKIFLNGLQLNDVTVDGDPTLLHIQFVLNHMGMWIVCGTVAVSDCFLEHYDAYSFQDTDDWLAIVPSEAVTFHPVISSYSVNNNTVAVLHHCICTTTLRVKKQPVCY